MEKESQGNIFPPGLTFNSKNEQRQYIETWLSGKIVGSGRIHIEFYDSFYERYSKSLYPQKKIDISHLSPDLLIVEEPERLLSSFKRLPNKSKVVGILHTNNKFFVKQIVFYKLFFLSDKFFGLRSTLSRAITYAWLKLAAIKARLLSGKTISLSGVYLLNDSDVVMNVNGVADCFFEVRSSKANSAGFYFIGKLIDGKNLSHAIKVMSKSKDITFDIFGQGPKKEKFETEAKSLGCSLAFKGPSLRPHIDLAPYKTFVNASVSEVLCTTTAEALAMGKFVIIPKHISNEFFYSFKNCLTYNTEEEFLSAIEFTKKSQPEEDDSIENLKWHMRTKAFEEYLKNEKIL